MSLKISDLWRKVFHVFGIVLLVLVIGALARVAVWEHFYYKSKEGSPRATTNTPFVEGGEVDETEVVEDDRKKHIVAPDKPRFLSIEKLGIRNARILEVSANSGEPMGVPPGIFDVGWARTSAKPGQGGTLLLDGHNGGPTKDGVFKNLPKLVAGDIITIERGDGQIFHYELYDSKILGLEDANAYMRTLGESPIPGRESISIISCTGGWIQAQRTYDSRIMIRAVLVEN